MRHSNLVPAYADAVETPAALVFYLVHKINKITKMEDVFDYFRLKF